MHDIRIFLFFNKSKNIAKNKSTETREFPVTTAFQTNFAIRLLVSNYIRQLINSSEQQKILIVLAMLQLKIPWNR